MVRGRGFLGGASSAHLNDRLKLEALSLGPLILAEFDYKLPMKQKL